MITASTRPLAASLAALLVLAPLPAVASPYAVLAPVSAGAPVPTDSPPVLPASPEAGAGAAPTDSAAISAATSPTEPLSDDPALEYRRGEQAYALGNYEQAVRHFERSYQLSNFADLLYNLGMAYAQWHGLDGDVGHLRKAKRLFQNYTKRLAENPEMDQSQRDEAEAQVARIDEQIAEHERRADDRGRDDDAGRHGPRVRRHVPRRHVRRRGLLSDQPGVRGDLLRRRSGVLVPDLRGPGQHVHRRDRLRGGRIL